jgi:hypothetical protein
MMLQVNSSWRTKMKMTPQQRRRNKKALKHLLHIRLKVAAGIQKIQAELESLDQQIAEYGEALCQ